MKQSSHNKKAFTLIELMITVIILGIIAAFALPNYTNMVSRAKERDAVCNLEVIREAVNLYIAREGSAPPALANVDAINTTLYINAAEQEGNTYNCSPVNIYQCWANNTDGWQLSFRLNSSNGDVYCSSGPCPTL